MNCFRKLGSMLLVVVMLLTIVPTTIFANAQSEEMSEEFRNILTDGKLVLNYAKPSSKDDLLAQIACDSFEDATGIFSLHNEYGEVALSDDLSKVTIGMWQNMEKVESHTVDVVWNYDEKAYKAAQSFMQNLPANGSEGTYFYLSDLEYINYLVNNLSPSGEFDEMANYSGELKSLTNNTNFSIKMESRGGGGDNPFTDARHGITRLYYRDSVYHVWLSEITVRVNHAIYVPESTADTKDALIAAAQKRVDDYIGTDVVKITDSGSTVSQYFEQERNRILAEIANVEQEIAGFQQEIAELKAIIEAEQANAPYHNEYLIAISEENILRCQNEISWHLTYKDDLAVQYDNAVPQDEYLKNAAGDYVFNIAINGSDASYSFVIVKDDSKLAVPTYISVDVSTDVSASTDSSEVPLDTVIKVEKITHGEEHERICGTLEIKDGEIFDIKLHSGSLDDYITELKNGKFKVRLPIKNEYKGKELVVYYVDANGNKTKYNVTVKNNFAFFETDHFSIYTLTTVSENDQTAPDTPNDNTTSPNTGDNSNVILWFVVLFTSFIGLIGVSSIGKKKASN